LFYIRDRSLNTETKIDWSEVDLVVIKTPTDHITGRYGFLSNNVWRRRWCDGARRRSVCVSGTAVWERRRLSYILPAVRLSVHGRLDRTTLSATWVYSAAFCIAVHQL